MKWSDSICFSTGFVMVGAVLIAIITSITSCEKARNDAEAEVKKAFAEAAAQGAVLIEPDIR